MQKVFEFALFCVLCAVIRKSGSVQQFEYCINFALYEFVLGAEKIKVKRWKIKIFAREVMFLIWII